MADPLFAADSDPRVFDTALRHAPRHCPVDQPPEASTPDVLAPSDQDAILAPGVSPAKGSGPVPKAQPLPQRPQPSSKHQQQQKQHTGVTAKHTAPVTASPGQLGPGGVSEAVSTTGGPAPATGTAASATGTPEPAPTPAAPLLLSVTLTVEQVGRVRLHLGQPCGGAAAEASAAPAPSAVCRAVRGGRGREVLPGLDAVKADHDELRCGQGQCGRTEGRRGPVGQEGTGRAGR